jgi:hypothetical protein
LPPAVAPEGNLVFWGKPSCPFYITAVIYMIAAN